MKTKQERKDEAYEAYTAIKNTALEACKAIIDPALEIYLAKCREIDANSQDWYLVKEWTTKAGLLARVQQCKWNRRLLPGLSVHDHYTGYVQVPEGDTKRYYDIDMAVHGGVTYEDSIPDTTGRWVGFDMAHYGDENILNPSEYAENECESLAEEIAKFPWAVEPDKGGLE